jgi:hypothetical protein
VKRIAWVSVLLAILGGAFAPVTATSYSHDVGAGAVEEDIDLRALPTLRPEWQWSGKVDDWRLEDGVVYVVGGPRLSALDAASGQEIWHHDLERECSCSKLEILPTRVAAGIDGRAVLIDRASGALVADVHLGDSIVALVPDPLVYAYDGPLDVGGLVLVDPSSGVEMARVSPSGGVSGVDRIGERLIVQGTYGGGSKLTFGAFDLSLTELWSRQLPAQSLPSREGDDIVVNGWKGQRQARYTLDPATGELLPEPSRAVEDERDGVDVRMLTGGLALVVENGKPPVLVRPRQGGTGDAVWSTELPAVVTTSVPWGQRVVLVKELWGSRPLLLVVDSADGTILDRVAGWRGMRTPRVVDDVIVAESTQGLAAARLDAFGPSEAASTTVEEAVAMLLAEAAEPDSTMGVWAVGRELEGLGEAAFPYLTAAIPQSRMEVVAMIGGLVAKGGYRDAAAPLAARVDSFLDAGRPEPEPEDEGDESDDGYLSTLGVALARIADTRQVPVLERLLGLDRLHGSTRLAGMAALGRLAPQHASARLSDLRARHPATGSWWQPPPADEWLATAALDVDAKSLATLLENPSPTEEASRRLEASMQAARSELVDAGDRRWLLFPELEFGSQEYWAAPLEKDGTAAPAVFVGSIPPPTVDPEDLVWAPPILEARAANGLLEVGYSGSDALATTFDELQLDSDGDGLTDRLEGYLGLDPRAADSDGDGLPDALDFAPLGRIRRTESSEEAAMLSLHETLQLAQFADARAEDPSLEPIQGLGPYSFLTGVPALEWRSGPVPTFVVEDANRCGLVTYRAPASWPRALEADELALEVLTSCPGWGEGDYAETYVMRSTDGGWVLADLSW